MPSLFFAEPLVRLFDLARSRPKLPGMNFFKRLLKKFFGGRRLKSTRQVGFEMSRIFKDRDSAPKDIVIDVMEEPHPNQQVLESASRPSLRRLKKNPPLKGRLDSRRRQWGLLKKMKIRKTQRDPTSKTLKRRVSNLNIGAPKDFRHITHYGVVEDFVLPPSSMSLVELYDTDSDTSSKAYNDQTDVISLGRTLTNRSISSTLWDIPIIFSDPETESIRVLPPAKRKSVPQITELELEKWQNPVDTDPIPQKFSTVKRKPVPYHILHGFTLPEPSPNISSPSTPTYLLHPSPIVCPPSP